jgi:hypothetical protein
MAPSRCMSRSPVRFSTRALRLLVALLLAGVAAPARAADEDGSPSSLPVDVHAFVSQGYMITTESNYIAHSRRGTFEFTEVGINFTKNVTDDLRVGMQLFSRDFGSIGNYKPQFDWFYLDYHFRDWLGLRAGRTKLPFGLYNETSDIDQARVPILLPQSLYSNASRDFLLAQTGFELYGYVPLGAAGAFDYRLYGGTIFVDSTSLASPGATVNDIDVPYLAGGRAMWVTPLDGLRAGASVQTLRLDLDYSLSPATVAYFQQSGQLPADFGGRFKYKLPVFLWVASVEYAANDLLLAAEYSRWRTDYETRPEVVPDGNLTSTRWYVMGSYRASRWFSPGIYYSFFGDGRPGLLTRDKYQQDLAFTLRYDITPNWLVKLEEHYMRGTAHLSAGLNSEQETQKLARDWGMFMLKTTAYF